MLLLIPTLLFVLVNILTLNSGHNWGGDFAQYILHAQNILGHRPYSGDIMIESPLVYPPRFIKVTFIIILRNLNDL
jgi:hypothetical protein